MKKYEYKIISIKIADPNSVEENILSALNKEGKEGWLVCSLNVTPRIAVNENEIKVLLAREATKGNRKKVMKEAVEKTLSDGDPTSTIVRNN